MPKIEIVTHCWSGDAVPVYHKLLCHQLSSLLLNRAEIDVQITVCREAFEYRTFEVLNYFQLAFCDPRSARSIPGRGELTLKDMPMPAAQLYRRATGRNMAALESDADVVWFTDVDHLFGMGCLDRAHEQSRNMWTDDYKMVWPKTVNIHKTHDLGDAAIEQWTCPRLYVINQNEFQPRREKLAWGGLQIVDGNWCRANGYLNGTDWVRSVDPAGGFKQCKCDVPFRKAVGKSCAVDIPNLFRMRHTRAGRDGGKKDHGKKTRETSK